MSPWASGTVEYRDHKDMQLFTNKSEINNPFDIHDEDEHVLFAHSTPSPKVAKSGPYKRERDVDEEQIEAYKFKINPFHPLDSEHEDDNTPDFLNDSHQKHMSKQATIYGSLSFFTIAKYKFN